MATSAFLRFDLETSRYTYNFISVKFIHCNWLYTVTAIGEIAIGHEKVFVRRIEGITKRLSMFNP